MNARHAQMIAAFSAAVEALEVIAAGTSDPAGVARAALGFGAPPAPLAVVRVCVECRRGLPLASFGANRARVDGLDTSCRECRNRQVRRSTARRRGARPCCDCRRPIATPRPRQRMCDDCRGFNVAPSLAPAKNVER